ncbi:MORC family CW-type zinc finger protein 3-like isoform 2-T6 [Clarias gariepinus]|uniref:MORC family CW-type zinc finger protein 3-like isoform X2 n=1 Tax=Clarias gariepinus TaxID=13013 RepID=UPI00234D2975|nr:MORC family CW-type zinc finger protein 3-like isoform X2 [Clarias gariepinus]XP_053352842.1 MORC family CW-type zinc finger protein 3-like isoform X2 [Clarias gariepinus]XP_053352844.1 MORC family CW-type zinc finger protein 3-like isoform X2 [Clarias gariepinus]
MTAQTNKGIPLSSINPRYLHSNSTSHTWPFSAIAALIDNAYDPDVNAKQFWIDKTLIKDQACLMLTDNGKGMDYDKMHKMLSFGFSDKKTVKGHTPVGQYGNGFKSGSMRLGKDAIIFSKKAGTMCVGLLSQTYLEKIKAENVIVPIVEFTSTGHTDVSVAPEYEECLHDILTHSLFNTKEDLLSEFSVIDVLCNKSKSGTRIIIWNLRRTFTGNLEFDFERDRYDLQIPADVYESTRETKKQQAGTIMSVPESEYSLRAYCSILYLKPRMQIILQGLKVKAQYVTKTLANVVKDSYKPVCNPTLKKGITISFGFNTRNKEHYGLMMYHKNRLIKAYERVACQRRANSTGAGVIGVIECNYLTPTHNKQDFDSTDEYRRTLLSVGSKLEEYWKEVRHSFKDCPDVLEDIVYLPDQNWVQCDQCLKWRKLPDCVDIKRLPKAWFCKMNSDPQYRSCEAEEEPDSIDEQQGYQETESSGNYKQDCAAEEESEDSDDEQQGYQKTYKQDEKNKKIQEKKSSKQVMS